MTTFISTLDLADAKRLAIALPLPRAVEADTILSRWLPERLWRALSANAWDRIGASGDFTPASPGTPSAAALALIDAGVLDGYLPPARRERLRALLHAIVAEQMMDAPVVSRTPDGSKDIVVVLCPHCPPKLGAARQHSHRLPAGYHLPAVRVTQCQSSLLTPRLYRIVETPIAA